MSCSENGRVLWNILARVRVGAREDLRFQPDFALSGREIRGESDGRHEVRSLSSDREEHG